MEGLTVEGIRTIDTATAGWQGFDRSLQMIVETWISKDIDCLVLWKMNDPRFGESTWKLTNVDRSEPDGVLFRVPSDFVVRDQ